MVLHVQQGDFKFQDGNGDGWITLSDLSSGDKVFDAKTGVELTISQITRDHPDLLNPKILAKTEDEARALLAQVSPDVSMAFVSGYLRTPHVTQSNSFRLSLKGGAGIFGALVVAGAVAYSWFSKPDEPNSELNLYDPQDFWIGDFPLREGDEFTIYPEGPENPEEGLQGLPWNLDVKAIDISRDEEGPEPDEVDLEIDEVVEEISDGDGDEIVEKAASALKLIDDHPDRKYSIVSKVLSALKARAGNKKSDQYDLFMQLARHLRVAERMDLAILFLFGTISSESFDALMRSGMRTVRREVSSGDPWEDVRNLLMQWEPKGALAFYDMIFEITEFFKSNDEHHLAIYTFYLGLKYASRDQGNKELLKDFALLLAHEFLQIGETDAAGFCSEFADDLDEVSEGRDFQMLVREFTLFGLEPIFVTLGIEAENEALYKVGTHAGGDPEISLQLPVINPKYPAPLLERAEAAKEKYDGLTDSK